MDEVHEVRRRRAGRGAGDGDRGVDGGGVDGGVEVRYAQSQGLRVLEPAPDSDSAGTIEGLIIPYEQPSQLLGGRFGFIERIKSGAGTRWFSTRPDIRYLYEHSNLHLMGRTSSGTVTYEERLGGDRPGVYGRVTLPDTTAGRDSYALVKRGDIRGHSFGFVSLEDVWRIYDDDDRPDERDIVEFEVYEFTLTASPAYQSTDAAARSRDAALQDHDAARRAAAAHGSRLTGVRRALALEGVAGKRRA